MITQAISEAKVFLYVDFLVICVVDVLSVLLCAHEAEDAKGTSALEPQVVEPPKRLSIIGMLVIFDVPIDGVAQRCFIWLFLCFIMYCCEWESRENRGKMGKGWCARNARKSMQTRRGARRAASNHIATLHAN